MKLEWYLFEHSYLTGIKYNPLECSLFLNIDAKITFEHPKSDTIDIKNLEDSFVEVEIIFEGVQYLRLVNSLNLLSNQNEDFGSIEKFSFKEPKAVCQGLDISKSGSGKGLSLELSEGNVITIFSKSEEIKFLNFVSEMIVFELGFERFSIKEIA